uniref:Nuclease associated modular domain-containing protein n=1 Tax=viral metagenome TaxID=1070528 RepID=A0A6M3M857_9ZZZZ
MPTIKGSHLTEKHKKAISKSLKGKMPKNISMIAGWNRGLTKETDDRLKKVSERARILNIKGIIGMKGRKHTEETKEKMRKNNKTKGLWQSSEYRRHMSKIHEGKMVGKDNSAYIDGRTPLVQRVRHCRKYKEWIKSVFEKDDYTCQDCRKRGIKLVAHHRKSFSRIWTENKIETYKQALDCKELWNIDNGKTLCIDCHRRYNTRE